MRLKICVVLAVLFSARLSQAAQGWYCEAHCIATNLNLRVAYSLGTIASEASGGRDVAWKRLIQKCKELHHEMQVSRYYTPSLAKDYFGDFHQIRIKAAAPTESCIPVVTKPEAPVEYSGPENAQG